MYPMDVRVLPVAYGMIELSRRSNLEDFIRYMCLWSAFNNIYQFVGDQDGFGSRLQYDAQQQIRTREVMGYHLPRVETRSDTDSFLHAIGKLDNSQTERWLSLPGVSFFVNRTLQGAKGNNLSGRRELFDRQGQRINGVLNRTRTVDPRYPYYAPIDLEKYEAFQAGDLSHLQLLSEQLAMLLYTVRNNLMHGHKEVMSQNDGEVVFNAYPLLEFLVSCFVKIPRVREW